MMDTVSKLVIASQAQRGRCWQPSSYLYSWEVEALVADIYSSTLYIYYIYTHIIYILLCTYAYLHSQHQTTGNSGSDLSPML